jgi:regulator of protease activity HflC (stomatin/prohibitin superfamily)
MLLCFYIPIIILILALFILKGVIVVKYNEAVVIERWGMYKRTLFNGIHFIIPIFDVVRPIKTKSIIKTPYGEISNQIIYSPKICLSEREYNFPLKNVITKDNLYIKKNVLLYYQIIDAKKALYNIECIQDAFETVVLTAYRKMVKDLTFDEACESYDTIIDNLKIIFRNIVDTWGVMVNKFELQDVYYS